MLPGGRICAYIPQLKNMRKMYIYLSCARVTSLISKVSFFHLSYQIYCVCSLYLRTYLFWKIKSNLTEWRKSKLCILVVIFAWKNCVEFLRFSFDQKYIIHSCLKIHTCTYSPTNRKEKSFGSLEIVGGIWGHKNNIFITVFVVRILTFLVMIFFAWFILCLRSALSTSRPSSRPFGVCRDAGRSWAAPVRNVKFAPSLLLDKNMSSQRALGNCWANMPSSTASKLSI